MAEATAPTSPAPAPSVDEIVERVLKAISAKQDPQQPDDARTRQIVEVINKKHAEELEALKVERDRARGMVQRLLTKDIARQAVEAAGFKSAAEAMTLVLNQELDVVEDEKSPDRPFRTVVRIDGAEQFVPSKDNKEPARPMTPHERALQLAADPKWKRLLDVARDDKKPKLPTHVVQPSQSAQPAQPEYEMSGLEEMINHFEQVRA